VLSGVGCVTFVFRYFPCGRECRHLNTEPHESLAMRYEIVRIGHPVALYVRSGGFFGSSHQESPSEKNRVCRQRFAGCY